MKLPEFVKILEVGPRDGLQNERTQLDTETKVELIDRLSQTGLSVIEVSSLVNPERVPQLADASEVFQRIRKTQGIAYPMLVPNMKGMERAMAIGVNDIALFTSASEKFNQHNINCSVAESLQRFEPVVEQALANNISIRAYISCAFGCPYENDVHFDKMAQLAELLIAMGCHEISLGDTIGIATPLQVEQVIDTVATHVDIKQLGVHFHDTRGQALANVLTAVQMGVTTVDAAIAGLGGCPFAQSSSGNVATEDVIYMLRGMDIETGVNLESLIDCGHYICEKLGRDNRSRVANAPFVAQCT